MLVFFTNLSYMEFQVRYLDLFFIFLVIALGGSGWEVFTRISTTLFLLYIKDLPNDVICHITIYADDNTLYSKCDQAFDLWQQLELSSELESDLWDTVDWGRKWLVNFSAGKTQLVSFDQSNNVGAINVKTDWSVIEEKIIFYDAGLTFSFKSD